MVMGVKREKRRSHDVGAFLYAHIPPTSPAAATATAVPAPSRPARRERENQGLGEEPGFVAGLFKPIREKECCTKLRLFMMLSGVLKKKIDVAIRNGKDNQFCVDQPKLKVFFLSLVKFNEPNRSFLTLT